MKINNNYRLLNSFSTDLEDELSLVVGKSSTGKTSLLTVMNKFLNSSINPCKMNLKITSVFLTLCLVCLSSCSCLSGSKGTNNSRKERKAKALNVISIKNSLNHFEEFLNEHQYYENRKYVNFKIDEYGSLSFKTETVGNVVTAGVSYTKFNISLVDITYDTYQGFSNHEVHLKCGNENDCIEMKFIGQVSTNVTMNGKQVKAPDETIQMSMINFRLHTEKDCDELIKLFKDIQRATE